MPRDEQEMAAKESLHLALQAVCACRPARSLLCWRAPRSCGRVAITFDDGPNRHTTPAVLDVLAEAKITCTFFVLGREVARAPDVLDQIVRMGHEVGIHGYDHSSSDIAAQVKRCEECIPGPAGAARLFRPAMGRRGLSRLFWLRRRGYTTVLWSFDALDSMRHEGKTAVTPEYERVKPGDIVLMHDDNPVCVAELPRLIAEVTARGVEPVTVSELIA